jgi:hypothetical protein
LDIRLSVGDLSAAVSVYGERLCDSRGRNEMIFSVRLRHHGMFVWYTNRQLTLLSFLLIYKSKLAIDDLSVPITLS